MHTNHHITKMEGFPVEAEGTVGGESFSFECEMHKWRFCVGSLLASGEAYAVTYWKVCDFKYAGAMGFTEAKKIIYRQCALYLRGKK